MGSRRRPASGSRAERLARQTVPVVVASAGRRRPAASPPPGPEVAALGRAGRRAALAVAGTGLFWVAATALGGALGWPQRARALCDLIALAGFGWALYLTYRTWRIGRATRG